ncbi:hypothetical protein CHUAL_001154 [Chamberlinius hualienensis]
MYRYPSLSRDCIASKSSALLQATGVMRKTLPMETANSPHISKRFLETVYEPSEDSFLLLDALENDRNILSELRPQVILEIGCGSGVVIVSLAKYLGNNSLYLATDINNEATLASKETALINKVNLEIINTDLVTGLLPRLNGKVDVLLFNPPYVPTVDEEITMDKLSASWAGGCKGRKIMDRLFSLVDQLMSPTGFFYLIALEDNNLDEITAIMSTFNFHSEIVLKRKSGHEKLNVMKFIRKADR